MSFKILKVVLSLKICKMEGGQKMKFTRERLKSVGA